MSSCCKEDTKKETDDGSIHTKDEHGHTSVCADESEQKGVENALHQKKSFMQIVLFVLGIVLIANVIVMALFTFRVNEKLTEAIDITKPQEGELLVIVPDDCPLCGEMTLEQEFITKQNIELLDTRTVSAGSAEGIQFIETYQLTQIPAMIFSSSYPIKPSLKKVFEDSVRFFDEMTAVWENTIPPFENTKDGLVSGLVDVTYLTDKSCAECYDVRQVQRSILARLGIAINAEYVVDVSDDEGSVLLQTYNITSVPAILLSPEANVYNQLTQVWSQVGTQEKDGTFVFRKNEALGNVIYRDLSTGRIVTLPKSE